MPKTRRTSAAHDVELALPTHCCLSRRQDGCQQCQRKRLVTSGQVCRARTTRVGCRSAVVPVGRQSTHSGSSLPRIACRKAAAYVGAGGARATYHDGTGVARRLRSADDPRDAPTQTHNMGDERPCGRGWAQCGLRGRRCGNPATHYRTCSISLGRQLLSIHGCSGPYMRRMVNQLLPGTVCSQLPSCPLGACGAKYRS